jgi:hypothetical protein
MDEMVAILAAMDEREMERFKGAMHDAARPPMKKRKAKISGAIAPQTGDCK